MATTMSPELFEMFKGASKCTPASIFRVTERDEDGFPKPSPLALAFKAGVSPTNARACDTYGTSSRFNQTYKSHLYPFCKEGEKILFGVEMEFSDYKIGDENKLDIFKSRRWTREGIEGSTLFSFVSDGSLRGGVEVVTAPFSSSFFFKKGREYIRKMVDDMSSIGVSEYNAGLHIHISRTKETARAYPLIHYMITTNGAEWQKLSRRSAFGYCEFNGNMTSHYNFFGYSSHHPTFEFRLFKSSTNKDVMVGSIELFLALMDYGMGGYKEATGFNEYLNLPSVNEKYASLSSIPHNKYELGGITTDDEAVEATRERYVKCLPRLRDYIEEPDAGEAETEQVPVEEIPF